MENILQGFNIRSDDPEEWISDQKDRIVEIIKLEEQNEKRI